ncbi:hypothetical protein AU476_33775 [Cupriavidus sp. UYMSc13B]|nr:hypothetical protein AU476_33775 [Cupriavidus sp. UYMSc13B]
MPVTLGEAIGNEVEVRQGLAPGQTIVTAGAHLLRAGQKVRPLQAVVPAAGPASAPASAPAATPKQG